MLKKLMTVKELHEATGYSTAQIHNQIAHGNIKPAFTSSSLTLISRAEFNRVVNQTLSGKYKAFKRVRKKLIAE